MLLLSLTGVIWACNILSMGGVTMTCEALIRGANIHLMHAVTTSK